METRSEMKLSRTLAVCVLGICLLGASAHAELYILGQVTGGDLDLCPEPFKMDVSPNPNNEDQALFTFINNCDNDGVLARIFFMENDDLITYVENQELLVYKAGTPLDKVWSLKEGNAMMPGGHPLGFTPQNSYGIYADPARPKNGLESGESLSVLFNLNVDFGDLIGAIDGGVLGLGIHAQSLPGGASGSFAIVPEPLTLSLLGIGALLIRNKRRGTAQIG